MNYLLSIIAILVIIATLPLTFLVWLIMRVCMWFREEEDEDKNRTTLYSPGKMW